MARAGFGCKAHNIFRSNVCYTVGGSLKRAARLCRSLSFRRLGCGSVCAAGAIIDLVTGKVYQPPFAPKGSGWQHWMFSGGTFPEPFMEYRVNSSLLIVRRAAGQPHIADTYYFLWENEQFRQILVVRGRKDLSINKTKSVPFA